MKAYGDFKHVATSVAFYESLFPVLLSVQVVLALLSDATQRWPQVSMFQRAVVDAVLAIILSGIGAVYFYFRQCDNAILIKGLHWANEAGLASVRKSDKEEEKHDSKGNDGVDSKKEKGVVASSDRKG